MLIRLISCFTIIFLCILNTTLSFSQNYKIFLTDSFKIELTLLPYLLYGEPVIIANDTFFFYSDTRFGDIRVYDSLFHYVKTIGGKTEDEMKSAASCHRSLSLITANNKIGIIFFWGIYIYDFENNFNNFINLFNPQTEFRKKDLVINHGEPYPLLIYCDETDSLIFLPVIEHRYLNSGEYDNTFLNSGIVGVLKYFEDKDTLQLLNLIGAYDSIYFRKNIPYLTECNYYYDKLSKLIYISNEASSIIKVYNTNGELDDTYGSHAKFPGIFTTYYSCEKNDVRKYGRSLLWTKKEDKYNMLLFRLKSLYYAQIFHDKKLDVTFRTYRPGVEFLENKDKTILKSFYSDSLCLNKKCIKPPSKFLQSILLTGYQRSYGLQIYQKGKLIFDEIMPTQFKIITVKDNNIYVHGRIDFNSKEYWIYKYKLIK